MHLRRARLSLALALAVLVASAVSSHAQQLPPAQSSGASPSFAPAPKPAAVAKPAAPQKPAAVAKPTAVHKPTPPPKRTPVPKSKTAPKPIADQPAVPDPALTDPQQAVADLVTRALATISDKDLSPLRRRELLHNLIARHFDMPAMAQAALGRHWAAATEAEQHQFIAAVDDYMVVTYAPRIAGYGKLKFAVRGQRAETGTRGSPDALLILTAADQPDAAPPIPIDWRLVRRGDGYQITDVIISGVSLIQMKRAEINSVVYWSDGQLTALLDRAAVLVSCAKE